MLFRSHLQDGRLAGREREIESLALACGLSGVCVCGTSPEDWSSVEAVPSRYSFPVLTAFGVHPWYADALPTGWEVVLKERLQHHPGAAVGEIGLDGIRATPPLERQFDVFERQLALAVELGRPVVLHGAKEWGLLFDRLTPYAGKLRGCLLHGFGASRELLRRFLDLGAYISFGGAVSETRCVRAREALRAVPSDRLLLETDAPDFFPDGGVPLAPGLDRINHPANLASVLRCAAGLRGVDAPTLEAQTEQNARACFGIGEPLSPVASRAK